MTDVKTRQAEHQRQPMRRSSWIGLGFLAALVAISAGVLGWWMGSRQDEETAEIREEEAAGASEEQIAEIPEIVDRFAMAWESGDPGSVRALYTSDGISEEVRLNEPADDRRGTEYSTGITAHARDGLGFLEFTDMEPRNVVVHDDMVVVEWLWSGMSGNHERGPADRTPFSTWGVTVFEMEGNLIARSAIYFNAEELFN